MEVPRRLVQASCRIFRLWTFFVLFLNHFVRIGEAAVPGPTVGPSMDSPDWRLPSEPDFCIGVCIYQASQISIIFLSSSQSDGGMLLKLKHQSISNANSKSC